MTFKTDDRVFETSTTTGAGDYTLDGAQVGYLPFSSMGANNLCPYFATDDTNWEVGIGTILTGPAKLQRTTILRSSNADAAVNWGAGTRKVRCALPAAMAFHRRLSKSVAGGVDIALTTDEQRRDVLEFTGLLTANINVTVDATPWAWPVVYNNTTGAFTLTLKVTGLAGVAITQGKRKALYCNGTDVFASDDDVIVAGVVPAGGSIDFMGTVIPSGWLAEDGSNVSRATYASLFAALVRSSVVTFDNTTDKVAWVAHGLSNGDVFKFSTTGAAPTGLTAGTTYFVVNKNADDFQLASTEGGAAINFTSNGTGVLTGVHAPWGDGDGATTFTLPDTRRKVTIGRGGTATSTIGARLGATGGEEAHALTSGENGPHSHNTVVRSDGGGGYNTGANAAGPGPTDSSGSGTAHNTMQPSLVVTKIIKT